MFKLSLQTLTEVALCLAIIVGYSSQNLWENYLDSTSTMTHVLDHASFRKAATVSDDSQPRTLWLQKSLNNQTRRGH